MKALLDTHALLWWLFNDSRLSQTAKDIIADPESDILVSAASAWEIATKYRIGKLPDAERAVEDLAQVLRQERFLELSVTLQHALAAGLLPGPHRDPFDRMLMAQSKIEELPVITNDPVFAQYDCQVAW
jgi:PIN domain nuclease of toxin-antitoxin system